MEAGNFAAAGGVSGAIIALGYAVYKICYRKKFRSKCCGAEMDVGSEPSPRKEVQIDLQGAAAADLPTSLASRRPTPHPSPALRPAADADLQIPKIEV